MTDNISRLASGPSTPDDSPFEWVTAADLREGDALASGLLVTKLDITGERVVVHYNDDTSSSRPALDFVLIKRRDITPAEEKLEHIICSAVRKRPGWHVGTQSRRGVVVAIRHEGQCTAYVGNGTDGIWCWSVLRNGELFRHGQAPAGPTSNMRAAEAAIAEVIR